ncbi:hypothetical protein FACS189443_0920 [Planctomycetales bacterium]|nr:hypothetical protein FACS189443_0920 [Planctomycetales bacterium]
MELANPLENEFAPTTTSQKTAAQKPPRQDRAASRGNVFADKTIPTTASAISLQSAQDNLWDQPTVVTANTVPSADWNHPQDNFSPAPTQSPYPQQYPQQNQHYPLYQYNPYNQQQPVNQYPTSQNQFDPTMLQAWIQQQQQYAQSYGANPTFGAMGNNPYQQQIQYQFGSQFGAQPYPDPYNLAAYQNEQNPPDNNTIYQALLMQEMQRRQAEEAKERGQGQEQNESDESKKEEQKKAADAWTSNRLMPVKISSPLGETMWDCFKTISPFCTPTGPDKGCGQPLVNKSWLDHPHYFGGFVGTIYGSKDLVSGAIKQKDGGTGGILYGYNLNEYWGIESRLHFSSIDIYDTDAIVEQIRALNPNYIATSRARELTIIDFAVQYYPLGNAKWKPYFKYGLGAGHETFIDSWGNKHSETAVSMPLGVGLRYWWNERLAIQADIIDNVVFGKGITKTNGNVSFAVGLTYSFGADTKKRPVQYWPARPSMGSKW